MKILVIQLRRIGDIILTTPVLSYLRKNFPDAQIDFLCEPMGKDVLAKNPYLRKVLIYDKSKPLAEIFKIRAERYDVVLDFLNNPRTAFLSWLSGIPTRVAYKKTLRSIFYNVKIPLLTEPVYASVHKLNLVRSWLQKINASPASLDRVRPEFFLSVEDEAFARDWLKSEGIDKKFFVVMAPVHRHPIRQWRLKGYRELGKLLSKKGYKVYLSYAPGEEGSIEEVRRGAEDEIRLISPTSIPRLAAIYKQARLVVTNDSGAMHLAVSVDTPTVTIYGPTNPNFLTPPQGKSGMKEPINLPMVAAGVPCLGCELSVCPVGHLCMEKLPEETVLESCLKILTV